MLCNSSLRTWSTDRGYSPTSILALKRGSNSKHQARQLWLTLVFLSRCSKNRQSETSTIALLLRVLHLELQAQRNRRQLVLGALTPMETHHHYVQAILPDNRLWPPLTFKDLGTPKNISTLCFKRAAATLVAPRPNPNLMTTFIIQLVKQLC